MLVEGNKQINENISDSNTGYEENDSDRLSRAEVDLDRRVGEVLSLR